VCIAIKKKQEEAAKQTAAAEAKAKAEAEAKRKLEEAAKQQAAAEAKRKKEEKRKREEALLKLAEMGFTDTSRNAVLLDQSHNNVAAVVDQPRCPCPSKGRGGRSCSCRGRYG
jgi:colicin import membrane protein